MSTIGVFLSLVSWPILFLGRVGQVDDNHIYVFPIFINIELEIEDVSIRYQMKNYAKIPSILVMGVIIVKLILFVDFDSFFKKIFKIITAPANQVPGIFWQFFDWSIGSICPIISSILIKIDKGLLWFLWILLSANLFWP